MKGDFKYKDINQVMAGIRRQIMDSVQWCVDNIPVVENPYELWRILKANTRFKNDPKNIELLQTSETLFDNNYHGVAGLGDCDCFTITAIGAFIAQGWGNIDIVLAGRSTIAPVHIYPVITWKGQRQVFDLTEPFFNRERHYPLTQTLPVTFNKSNMSRLVLAENYGISLSEDYVHIPQANMYMHKSQFLNEVKQLPKEYQDYFMSEYWPEHLGIAAELLDTLVTVGGKVITYIGSKIGGGHVSPTDVLPPSTVITAPGPAFTIAMINNGNAIYYSGKVWLTEAGLNTLSSQPWKDEATKTAYLNSFPFSVPESWKSTLAPYEVQSRTSTNTTTPPGAATTGATAGTTAGTTTKPVTLPNVITGAVTGALNTIPGLTPQTTMPQQMGWWDQNKSWALPVGIAAAAFIGYRLFFSHPPVRRAVV